MNATIPQFTTSELEGQSPRKLVVLSGSNNQVWATTCEEYVAMTWPDLANTILEIFDYIGAIRPGAEDTPHSGLLHVLGLRAQYAVPPTQEDAEGVLKLRLTTTPMITAIVFEAVSWLITVMQPVIKGRVSNWSCAVALSRRSDDTLYLIPVPGTEVLSEKATSNCWLPLVPNTAVADEYTTPARPLGVEGLELSFELLCHLCGIQYSALHDGGVVLVGYTSIVYPVRVTNDCLEWHFEPRCIQRRRHCSTSGPRLKITDVDILREYKRHFVGLWAEPVITLGTDFCRSSKLGWTSAREKRHEHLPNGREIGGSLTLPKILTVTGTQVYKIAKSRRNPYLADAMDFMTHLDTKVNSPVILYSVSEKRAWMVSFVSVLLHLGRARASNQPRLAFHIPPCAKAADGGLAAFEHIRACRHNPIRKLRQDEILDEEEKNNTVQEYLKKVWAAMDCVERESNKVRGLFEDRIIGYEMADIACWSSKLRMKSHKLDGMRRGRGWGPLLDEVDIVLLYEGLDDPIIAGKVGEKDNSCAGEQWTSIPRGFNILTGSLPCLIDSCRRFNKGTVIQFLTENHLWHNPAHSRYLFRKCDCRRGYHCNKLQELRTSVAQTNRPSHKDLIKHSTGAVIFRYSDDMDTIRRSLKEKRSEHGDSSNNESDRYLTAVSSSDGRSLRSDSGYSSGDLPRPSAVLPQPIGSLPGSRQSSSATLTRTSTPMRTPTSFWSKDELA